jgi:hypothetical protein
MMVGRPVSKKYSAGDRLEANYMIESRTFKPNAKIDTPMARVHTQCIIDQVKNTKPYISGFINEMRVANRIADGNYVLTQPEVVVSLRELAVDITTALAYAGMAQNSPDMKITVEVQEKKVGA